MSRFFDFINVSDETLMAITMGFLQTSDEAEVLYSIGQQSNNGLQKRLIDQNVWAKQDIATLAERWSKNATEIWERGGVPAPPLDEWWEYLQNKEQ